MSITDKPLPFFQEAFFLGMNQPLLISPLPES